MASIALKREKKKTLTVSSLFKVLAKVPVDAKVQSPRILVTVFVANLRPLEEYLEKHKKVHRDDAKPQYPSLPLVGDA